MVCGKFLRHFLWHKIANMQRLKFKCRERKGVGFNWLRLWCQCKVFPLLLLLPWWQNLLLSTQSSSSIFLSFQEKVSNYVQTDLIRFFLSCGKQLEYLFSNCLKYVIKLHLFILVKAKSQREGEKFTKKLLNHDKNDWNCTYYWHKYKKHFGSSFI